MSCADLRSLRKKTDVGCFATMASWPPLNLIHCILLRHHHSAVTSKIGAKPLLRSRFRPSSLPAKRSDESVLRSEHPVRPSLPLPHRAQFTVGTMKRLASSANHACELRESRRTHRVLRMYERSRSLYASGFVINNPLTPVTSSGVIAVMGH